MPLFLLRFLQLRFWSGHSLLSATELTNLPVPCLPVYEISLSVYQLCYRNYNLPYIREESIDGK